MPARERGTTIPVRAKNMSDRDNESGGFDPLKSEALAWVEQLISGEATERDADAVRRWRAQSPAHARAFAEAVRLRRALGPAARELGHVPAGASLPKPFPLLGRARVGRRAFLGGAVGLSAAAAGAFLVVRPPFGLWPSLAEFTADYRTSTGEQRKVAIANGVSVELNTQTSIALRSTPQDPGIELIAGEAAITAARDAASPFVVLAATGRTSAVQAKFDVRRDGPWVCVTCLDGQVGVDQGSRSVALRANQQVRYADAGMGTLTTVDAALVTSWREGLLVFHDAPLSTVIDEVNRYRPGRIILAGVDLGRRRVNASFHLDDLEEVIPQVQKLAGVRVTSLPGGIVILS